MFNTKSGDTARSDDDNTYELRTPVRANSAPSVIAADVTITGNIVAAGDLQIDGRVDGDVKCATLSQGADSRVKGTITADSARLGGTVEGAVNVRSLTVVALARITGDVAYETIAVENGAHLDGRLKYAPVGGGAAATSTKVTALKDKEGTETAA